MIRVLTSGALLACAAAFACGCGHAPGYPPNPIARPGDANDFATLYKKNCAACHGANGQNGPAMDLANPEYQALVDDASLRKWISGGMPGTQMMAFAQSEGGMLTSEQVETLIAGMRQEWSSPNALGGSTPPAYAQTQSGDAQRGALTYKARCAGCHAETREQLTSPAYLTLVSDQVLRTIAIAGRPDIGQPDWRHDSPGGKETSPLSSQDVDDLVRYLASLRNPEAAAATSQSNPSRR